MHKMILGSSRRNPKVRQNIFFGFTVTVMSSTLLSALSVSAAPSPIHEVDRDSSAWEQLCLRGTSAACDKASALLADRLLETDDVSQEKAVRDRLVRVSLAGCQAGHIASCSELVSADETPEHKELALKIANKQCVVLTKAKAKSESCQLKARLTALPDAGKDLLEEPLTL